MKHHRFTEIWPLMRDEDFARFKADIAANGLRLPILTYDGQLLDGRNRERACEETGVAARYEDSGAKSDDEALDLVVSLNQHRRHLTMEQRAFAAARLANLKNGSNRYEKKIVAFAGAKPTISETETMRAAAAKVGVSYGSAVRAKAVLTHGDKDDEKAVLAGETSLTEKAESLIKRKPRAPKAAKPPKRAATGRPRKDEARPVQALPKRNQFATVEEHRKWVDPDFKGTAYDWTMEYGHVQVMTGVQYNTDRFAGWTHNLRLLVTQAKNMEWPRKINLRLLTNPNPRDIAKLTEALNYFRPIMAEMEEALKVAISASARSADASQEPLSPDQSQGSASAEGMSLPA